METARLGIVGLGWFGGVLADAARASGAAEVVSCYARSSEARTAFAEHHGCRAAAGLDDLLADPDVTGVIVATPHSTHADIAVAAAEAGKHVFVEKPLTLTVADAKRVGAAASRAGVIVQVGHNRRRQPANRRIKSMIDDGELGTVLQLEGMHTSPGAHKPDLPAWRKDPLECPFGGMTALGVHTVDTFHYFMGPAKKLTAFSTRVRGFNDLDDATTVLLEYGSGQIASIGTNYFVPPVVSLSVFGSDAAAWNEEDGSRLYTQLRGDPVRSEQEVETIDTMRDEIVEFAACINDEAQPETGITEAIEVAAVLEGIGRSLESGTTVDLGDLRS
jgi:predicted dehydrogenase